MKRELGMGAVATVPTRRGIYPDARPSRSPLPPRAIPRKRNGDSVLALLLIVAVVLAVAVTLSGPIVRFFVP